MTVYFFNLKAVEHNSDILHQLSVKFNCTDNSITPRYDQKVLTDTFESILTL